MAKVFKRSGSDFYYGRFKVDGKETWFSTKCTDRKQAQAVADGKAHAARGKINVEDYFIGLVALLARLPKDDQDAKRNDYARRLMQGQSSTLKITDAWQTWMDSPLKGNPGPATTRSYNAEWKRFSKWIAGHKVECLHEITETHAQDYIADLWKSKVSPRTFKNQVPSARR